MLILIPEFPLPDQVEDKLHGNNIYYGFVKSSRGKAREALEVRRIFHTPQRLKDEAQRSIWGFSQSRFYKVTSL
ncbi:MAG: hypothetical protein ABSC11_11625 [Smithella sp.]|jgi:hypothetical protein